MVWELPEGYSIVAYLSIGLQVANLIAFAFVILSSKRNTK